jgi:tetratricopeptide (TPR) repeat protein
MGSLETGRALVRAREICTLLGGRTELFTVLQGLEWHNEFRLQLETARDLGEQLLTLAEDANEPGKLMAAHNALGLVFLLQGKFTAARDHFEQASPRFDWGQSGFFGAFFPCFGAWALWALGYADQALKWSREALASAEALSRPAPLANALSLVAVLHMFLRDTRMAQERAEAAIAIAAEQGFPFELAYGTLARGWALAEKGHLEEGIAEMRRAVTAGEETGFAARPRWSVFLAEACAKSEGPGVGLKLLAEGLGLMEAAGERMYEAELHRVKGELLLMQGAGNTVEAESCFRTAIEVARRQGGKSLELRATVSVARLMDKEGRRDEARTMLSDIYGWFTEGFDTADLKDAKSVLDELSA